MTHKYNGKELETRNGMNLYDYGARLYDPLTGLFTSIDPLCEKYYHVSPYAYCMGNPVKYVDPDGLRPKSKVAALMAKYVYKDDNHQECLDLLLAEGWKISDFDTSIKKNYTRWHENGLQSTLFERTEGQLEYAYVFAGTNSLEDVLEDITQVIGLSPQYHMAIYNARRLSDELKEKELTFVGHSLGGGEAIASSMATGRAAITFNPAAVSPLTMKIENLNKNSSIVNYRSVGKKVGGRIRIGGDVLNNFQEKVGLLLPGVTIGVETGLLPTHTIDDFLKHKLPNP